MRKQHGELGANDGRGDDRLPWDCWPKEAPEEGDEQAPADYQAPPPHKRQSETGEGFGCGQGAHGKAAADAEAPWPSLRGSDYSRLPAS